MQIGSFLKLITRFTFLTLSLLPIGYFWIAELTFTNNLLISCGILVLIISTQLIVSKIFDPIDRIKMGIETIRDGDFTIFLNKSGSHEANTLIDVYNEMVQELQNKRIENKGLQQYFEQIVNEIPFAVMIISEDTTLKYANKTSEQMFQFDPAKYKDRNLSIISHPIFSMIEKGNYKDNEIIKVTGQQFKINHSKFFMAGENYQVITLGELTDKLDAYQIDSWKRIVRVIAHEINNSISPILSINQSLSDYIKSNNQFDEDYVEGIESVNRRLSHLSKFISDYSHIAKVPNPNRKNIPTDEFFERLIRFIKTDNIKISYSNLAHTGFLFIDEEMFEQAMINILKNAKEACENETNPEVSIEIIKEAHYPIIKISDNGVGISEEAKENLFVPYFTTKKNGSGIALSLVKEILSRHHFQYYLESEIGKGTDFFIKIK